MLLRTLLTEDEADQVWCPLRLAFVVTVLIAHILQVYVVVVLGNTFDVQAYCMGMGTLIGVTGVGLWASSKQTET